MFDRHGTKTNFSKDTAALQWRLPDAMEKIIGLYRRIDDSTILNYIKINLIDSEAQGQFPN